MAPDTEIKLIFIRSFVRSFVHVRAKQLTVNGFAFCLSEPTTPSPTSERAEHDWTWIILGLVIGLVILSIVILVLGAM